MNRRTLIKMLGTGLLLPGLPGWAKTTHRRIILLELAGANDGLNTVIPKRHDHYYKLRPGLALNSKQRIDLTDEFALHGALKPLLPLWDTGELAILHGLGYPKPNRSHFSSIALWETGGDGHEAGNKGWITHDLEHACARQQLDACGISLDGRMGLFTNADGNWLSMRSAGQFAKPILPTDLAASTATNPLMQLLVKRTRSLEQSLTRIANKIDAGNRVVNRSGNKLTRQTDLAASLINAGVEVPVLKLSLGGFDTHENQFNRHQRLLRNLATSIHSLRKQLIKSGEWNNTVLVTYSEFGRTAAENSNGGTDHGTVAPHFVMGGQVNGGLYGESPAIPADAGTDMAHTMDYRALYSALLKQWLQTDSNQFAKWSDVRLDRLV